MIDAMIQSADTASVSLTVADNDTAIALGSGDVAVLGTPRVVALCEQAAVAAISNRLDPEMTSVGISISIDHLEPTPVGRTVIASATVTVVDGRSVEFELVVAEGTTTVARGIHTRVLVNRARFEKRTQTAQSG